MKIKKFVVIVLGIIIMMTGSCSSKKYSSMLEVMNTKEKADVSFTKKPGTCNLIPVTLNDLKLILSNCPDSVSEGLMNKKFRIIKEGLGTDANQTFYYVIPMNHKGMMQKKDILFAHQNFEVINTDALIKKMQNDTSISYQEFNEKLMYDSWAPQPSAGSTDSIKPDEWRVIFHNCDSAIISGIKSKKLKVVKHLQFDDIFYLIFPAINTGLIDEKNVSLAIWGQGWNKKKNE